MSTINVDIFYFWIYHISMIDLKNINYSAEDKNDIIKDLSVSFPDKKITVITGANGSGKSTLVKIIMGILHPTSGNVFFRGEDITNMSITDRAKRGITMAFQQPVTFKGITVKKMIEIANGHPLSVGQVCEYLSKVGLCAKNYVDRELSSRLSGGEMKRIELAVSLAKSGEVFLFDEPEAGIDLWSFEGLVNIFESLHNKTVIIVSHQQKILDIADNILLLSPDGKYSFGAKDEILCKMGKPRQ